MITVEETKDRELVASLLDDTALSVPMDTWFDAPQFTYLVAKEDGNPRLLALLVAGGTETTKNEIHLSAPTPWMHVITGCRKMKQWIKDNRDWDKVWSFTLADNPTALELAKQLGFEHSHDEENRRFIALNLNN